MGQKGVQSIFLGLLLYVLVISAAADVKHLNIWPMPKQVNHGHGSLYLGNDFELKTDGSKYPDSSGILKDGFLRIIDVVKATHVIDAKFSHFNPSRLLKGIHIVISSPSDEVCIMKTRWFCVFGVCFAILSLSVCVFCGC